MGNGNICRSESCKIADISKDIEINAPIPQLSKEKEKLKVIKFGVIYYYSSLEKVIASNLVTASKFIPGLNILTIPLSLDRDFAHVGLIIYCEDNKFFVTHKTSDCIYFFSGNR